ADAAAGRARAGPRGDAAGAGGGAGLCVVARRRPAGDPGRALGRDGLRHRRGRTDRRDAVRRRRGGAVRLRPGAEPVRVRRCDRAGAGLAARGGRVERARGPHRETIHLAYDARRRVVERRVERDGFRPKTWRYGWDAQDRLVACETPEGERWAYGYDAFGRRVWKRRLLEEAEEAWVRGRFPHLVRSVAAGGRSALDVWPRRPAGASEVDAAPPVVGNGGHVTTAKGSA
ncbi:RHS repeat protein, partial [Methylobacterium sp. IIF4SW-B5]|nr:RHS repeat protein [Methylobacterium ajmalii]